MAKQETKVEAAKQLLKDEQDARIKKVAEAFKKLCEENDVVPIPCASLGQTNVPIDQILRFPVGIMFKAK